jgi:hypothetical protein
MRTSIKEGVAMATQAGKSVMNGMLHAGGRVREHDPSSLPEVTGTGSVENEGVTVSDWKASHFSCRLELKR